MTFISFVRAAISLPMMMSIVLPPAQAEESARENAQQNAKQNDRVARIVAWRPKPGMEREFEEGYKRHLEWHRKNDDTWTWHGWMLISGERDGTFVDGTFFHKWTDLDSPVNPGADSANNSVNVEPYADVRSVATFEAVPALTNFSPQNLSSPLLTFCYIELLPGHDAQFESLTAEGLRGATGTPMPHALLRPVNGTSEYLLLLAGEKVSDLGTQAAFLARLLQSIAKDPKRPNIVVHVRTETARHRPDMSYIPAEKPNTSGEK